MKTTKSETIAAFITRLQLEMLATQTAENPAFQDEAKGVSHWLCTLKYIGRGADMNARLFRVVFSMGSALKGPPSMVSVLDCLASDAGGLENAPAFEDWASEYGYEVDSRKAEKTFQAIQRQAAALAKFLGADEFDNLLWRTERE